MLSGAEAETRMKVARFRWARARDQESWILMRQVLIILVQVLNQTPLLVPYYYGKSGL